MYSNKSDIVLRMALAALLLWWSLAATAGPPAANSNSLSPLVKGTLLLYAKQVEQYPEGEGEPGEGESTEGEGEGEHVEGETDDTEEGEGEAEGEHIEGEGETPSRLESIPWREYAAVGGVVLLAFGILWVAEEPPSPCMVATAAYGTPLSEKIVLLRMFRDQMLLSTTIGTAFVDIYYRTGGMAAEFIAVHPWAARLMRLALLPILAIAAFFLLVPVATTFFSYGLLSLWAALMVYCWYRLRFPARKAPSERPAG